MIERGPHQADKTQRPGCVAIPRDWWDFLRPLCPVYGHRRNVGEGIRVILERYRFLFQESCRVMETEKTFTPNEMAVMALCLDTAKVRLHALDRAEHLGQWVEREARARRLHIEASPDIDKVNHPLDLADMRRKIDSLHLCDRMAIVAACEFYWLFGQGVGMKIENLWSAFLNRWPDYSTNAPRRPMMPRKPRQQPKRGPVTG